MFQTGLVLALASALTAHAYEGVLVTDGGAVTGTVTYGGAVPAAKALKITTDAEYCGQWNVKAEDLVVSAAGGLANSVVFVGSIERGKAAVATEALLANTKCHYEPHVQAVTVGSTLVIRNDDPILHNTHIRLPGSTVLNIALPLKDQTNKSKLTRDGMMKVGCDAGHTWMAAYVAAFTHPYFAVTDAEGRFAIRDLPPGTYTLVSWHEKLKQKTQSVVVPAKGEVKASFRYP